MLFGIEEDKWYSVCEVSGTLRCGVDAVRDRIRAGKLKAFVLPSVSSKRKRRYQTTRILGAELIRFIKANHT